MNNSLIKKQAKLCNSFYVLDVGFAILPNKFLVDKKVVGVDVKDVVKPSNYFKVEQLNLNKNKLPYKEEFYSVICGSVLEHVENPSFVLRECNRVLVNEGQLIVTVPNGLYWWELVHNMFIPFYKDIDKGAHLNNWNKLDMIRLLNKNGFKVVKVHSTYIKIPLLDLNIPLPNCLNGLSWSLIYDCVKISKPNREIID